MKKSFALILALVLTMSLSTAVFAADQTGVGLGEYTTNVTGTYVEGTTASGTVYSVDIAWKDMSFTYYAEKAPVWDAEKHEYSEATPAEWEGEGTITVTNHSNAVIQAKTSYTAEAGYEDAEMQFDYSTDYGMYLDTAAAGNQATSNTITVTPAGTLPSTANSTTIGTIKVTISDAEMDLTDASSLSKHESQLTAYAGNVTVFQSKGYDITAASEAYSTANKLLQKCTSNDATADYTATATALVEFYNEVSKLQAQADNAQ